MKILHLTLTRQWFDMIASGEKREEYREIKQYWIDRLMEEFTYADMAGRIANYSPKHYDIVRFRNGYAKDAPEMDVELEGISFGGGNPEWGAEPGERYFVLQLGEVLSMKNYAYVVESGRIKYAPL